MALEQAGAYEFVNKLSKKLNTNVEKRDVLFRWAKAKVIFGQGYIEEPASHFDEATWARSGCRKSDRGNFKEFI